MALEIYESAQSRETRTGRSPSARVMYFLRGTEDEREVRLLVLATAPVTYEGVLVRMSTEQKHLGGGVWTAWADYGLGEKQATTNPGAGGSGSGDSGDSFQQGPGDPIGSHVRVSVGGRQQHITQSLYTAERAQKTTDTRALPNHKGTIGYSRHGVAGCDIPVPHLTWSETWSFDPRFITWFYVQQLRNLYGRVNNSQFRNFANGEVMFIGAEIEHKQTELTNIVFNFHAEENIGPYQLTPEFNPVNKDGHEYLWVEYEDSKDASNPLMVPRAVHVEVVGRPGLEDGVGFPSNEDNFLKLGIGF